MRARLTLSLLVVLLLACAATAQAKTVELVMANQYGQTVVAVETSTGTLVAYTPETNYMSLEGFARWLTWREYETWFPRDVKLPVTIRIYDPS